jgi:hypothetical protein
MANIKLNNNEYAIPDSVLATHTADFVAHLRTIAGNGLKVVVGGVEYSVDAAKVAGAVANLEVVFSGLNSGSDEVRLAPGLYETGAIALCQEGDIEGASAMMKTTWGDLLANGTVHVKDGVVCTDFDDYEWVNPVADILDGDLVLPSDESITAVGNVYWDDNIYNEEYDEYGGYVGNFGFIECHSLTNIYIPLGVVSLGESAFEGCSSLTSVIIPNSVTSIGGENAFAFCNSLTSVVIPDSVTSISGGAFYYCTSLSSVVIPDSVTFIGNGAFKECSSITSIVIPDGVTSIAIGAFENCSSLSSVVIGDGVTFIDNNAFLNCPSLSSVVIPDGVTFIGGAAFAGCTSLNSVVIPDSVTFIGYNVFASCTSLNDIIFNGAVTQWLGITKDNGWNSAVPATHVTCSDGTVAL